MFCTQCGTENKNSDTACIACGAPLASTRIQENLFDDYSSSINEKLGKFHGISRKFYLNEAEETKKRIRNKLIVSAVIAIPLLLSWFATLVSYLPEATIPELQTATYIELHAAVMSLMTPLVLGLAPLGISTATEYLRDHQEYKKNRNCLDCPFFLRTCSRDYSRPCHLGNPRLLLPEEQTSKSN